MWLLKQTEKLEAELCEHEEFLNKMITSKILKELSMGKIRQVKSLKIIKE